MSKNTYEEKNELFPKFPCFLFTLDDLNSASSRQPMKCICIHCNTIFTIPKNQIQARIKSHQTVCWCSRTCQTEYKRNLKNISKKPYYCHTCGKYVNVNEYYGSGQFCCRKCSNTYSSKFGNTIEK